MFIYTHRNRHRIRMGCCIKDLNIELKLYDVELYKRSTYSICCTSLVIPIQLVHFVFNSRYCMMILQQDKFNYNRFTH